MIPKPSRVRFEGSEGISLFAELAGPPDGAPVILLHGGGQTRQSWSEAMGRLAAEGYCVLNVDQRGHGESDWSPTADYSVFAMAADVRAVLATLDRPAALVGASLGGIASFYAAATATSNKPSALVMVDIALRPNEAGAARITNFMAAHADGFTKIEDAVAAVALYNPHRSQPPTPDGLRKNLRQHADGRLYWHWDPRILKFGERAENDRRHEALVTVAGNITIPMLLVRGAQSDVLTAESITELQGLVPQTEVLEVAGAGHMVAGDRNDIFNEGVLAFLRRHHPAREVGAAFNSKE